MTEAIVIDVSAAQGRINWPALAASGRCIGAIVKATEGTGGVDAQFAANWTGAPISGMLLGAYHFARPSPTLGDAARQADHFIDTLGDLTSRRRFILALDIEVARGVNNGADFDAWIRAFRRRVTERSERRCWTYTGGPWWNEHVGRLSVPTEIEHAASPLWIAAYCADPTRFVAMTPWRAVGWKLHQRSGNTLPGAPPAQHYDGIVGEVDTSVVRGPLDSFWAFLEEDDALSDTDPAPTGPRFDGAVSLLRAGEGADPADRDPPVTDPGTPLAIRRSSSSQLKAIIVTDPDSDPPQGAA